MLWGNTYIVTNEDVGGCPTLAENLETAFWPNGICIVVNTIKIKARVWYPLPLDNPTGGSNVGALY